MKSCKNTLLSHRYSEVLMGLKGSKSMLTFFSFPSSVTMVPQYITRPLVLTEKEEKENQNRHRKLLEFNIQHLKETYLSCIILISAARK